MLSYGTTQKHEQNEKRDLHGETDDSSARGRKEECTDGYERQNAHDSPTLAPDLAEDQRDQSNGNDQLRKTGEVIAVHIGTKRDTAVAHLTKPVEFTVERQVLEDAENADDKSQAHKKPDKGAPVLASTKGLVRQKENKDIGDEQLQLDSRVVRRSCGAENELRGYHDHESEQRQKQGRERQRKAGA